EREAAGADLLKLGPLAYPALNQAAQASELEYAQRAKALLQNMRQNIAAKDLRLQHADTILTPTFPIVGRILTPTIKAEADLFGEVQLPLAKLRSLRATATSDEINVTIDAARYAAAGNSEWLATDFHVTPRTRLTITATGQVDLSPQTGGQHV